LLEPLCNASLDSNPKRTAAALNPKNTQAKAIQKPLLNRYEIKRLVTPINNPKLTHRKYGSVMLVIEPRLNFGYERLTFVCFKVHLREILRPAAFESFSHIPLKCFSRSIPLSL